MSSSVQIEEYFKYVEHRIKDADYRLERKLCDMISNRLFDGIEVVGLEALREQRQRERLEGTTTINVYIARHLSEFDWQEIQRVLTGVGMMTCVQAGDNLFIGPLDPILRYLGGFKVFREEVRIFSDHWLKNNMGVFYAMLWKFRFCKKIFTAVRLKPIQPLVIDQTLAKDIYITYTRHLIDTEGRDILMFPEYTKDADKKTKYGRSYSGRLLDFTPLLFRMLKDINKKTDRRMQLVPVNVSYERIVEDQMFKKLERMKSHKLQKRFAYIVDYFFNYTHWIYQRRKGRVVIKFGDPVVLRKTIDFKMRLHDELKKKVGALQVVFPTQIVGYAFDDDVTLTEEELLKRIEKTIQAMKQTGADLRYIENVSSSEILSRAYELFDQHRWRRILIRDAAAGTYTVLRPDVLVQYKNHVGHLVGKWNVKDQLKRLIDMFRDEKE